MRWSEQAGGRKIGLTAATGSARELIGAYLGTPHVYNEISAHAAGAARLDPEVDTIFEIGGQDAKYILLRNRVPIDYAMNASCSAGTGSFLEECAQGDLGLPLAEIAEAALQARRPVQLKATCAAFINSDIRTALQEGYSPSGCRRRPGVRGRAQLPLQGQGPARRGAEGVLPGRPGHEPGRRPAPWRSAWARRS